MKTTHKLLWATLFAATSAVAAAQASKPNIVLILADDFTAAHVEAAEGLEARVAIDLRQCREVAGRAYSLSDELGSALGDEVSVQTRAK